MTRIITSLLLLTLFAKTSAQQQSTLHIVARPTPTTIKLRWGVSDPLGWKLANQYGYIIERYTVVEGKRVLDQRIKKVLTPRPITPALLPDWEPYIEDDYVAVAAQALYGEDFELDDGSDSEMAQLMNQALDLENRFSFLMYAADQSVKAAELAGLYWEDQEVSYDRKYLYKIYTLVPPHIHKLDTTSAFVGLEDYYELPPPRDVKVLFGDQVSMVSWNMGIYQSEYNAFWIERSDDQGRTFQRITDIPFVPTQKKKETGWNDRTFKTDSLPENNKQYLYRVIGVNAFGELSIPSDTVGGEGLPVFTSSPIIKRHKLLEDGEVQLYWTFPEKGKSLLKNYDLYRQNLKTKQEELVAMNVGGVYDSTFIDHTPRASNYYLLRANDRYGRHTTSFPYFVQLEDSIPPLTPVGLSGTIDTLGIVRLFWEPNSEPDLHGYRLFKANYEENEFVQVDGPLIKTNTYNDTLELKNLHEKVFYKVLAMDHRFNPSELSKALQLKKPDVLPPVSPVFSRVTNESAGIALSWELSSSEDVIEHLLYRESEREADWTLIHVINAENTKLFYLDTAVVHNTQYAYTMLAIDDDGLESAPAAPVVATRLEPDAYPMVGNFHYLVNKEDREVKISWDYPLGATEKFLIYKTVGEAPFQLYKSLEAAKMEFTEKITPGTGSLRYKVMAVMTNGHYSQMSDELLIELE